jgi:branched-chain amino acid transport system substrate-binding protein
MPTIPASFHAGNLVDSNYIFLPIASYSSPGHRPGRICRQQPQGTGNPRWPCSCIPRLSAVDPWKMSKSRGGRPEDRNRRSRGTRQGPGQHRHAATPQEQRRSIRHQPDGPVPGGHHAQRCQPPGMSPRPSAKKERSPSLGCHYTGGNDLVSLAGPAAENYYWTTSYIVTSEPGPGTDAQLALAKKYGRDDKTANSHNYTNGVMVAQVAAEPSCAPKPKA